MRRYPLILSGLFGSLQTGYFLQLSFAFSSAAITLFGVTLAWLSGAAGGLWLTRRVTTRWWQVGLLSVGSYLLCCLGLALLPLQGNLLPLYLGAVMASGLYAGWFFATAARGFRGQADRLFFWENNGFVVGIAFTTLAYLYVGRLALWALPVALAIFSYPRFREDVTHEN